MKKNDPKNEALAKLGMMNLNSPKSVSAFLSDHLSREGLCIQSPARSYLIVH